MPTPARPTGTLWQRLTLILSAPVVFLLISDITIRVSGIETDVARNENFDIGVPVWLLGDENCVDIQRVRLEEPRGVRAEDVGWLSHFEEARYIQYKLKPNIDVHASNPFNRMELRKGKTFRLVSNSRGFRTRELDPKPLGVTRIVTIGDSSTFGWGVEPEYTFQHLLEDRFDRGGSETAIEVLNLGISGHTSRHGLGLFEHYVRDLEPDVLIMSYGANDARRVLQSADDTLDRDDTWRGTARDILYRLETFRLLRRLILAVYDPFDASQARADSEGEARDLIYAVDRDTYIDNLRSLVGRTRELGAQPVLVGVCIPPAYLRGMQYVADTERVPLVDALELFRSKMDDLRAHRLYADEVRFYEELYGVEEMAKRPEFHVTTDGCHPGRAGHNLIADALHDVLDVLMVEAS